MKFKQVLAGLMSLTIITASGVTAFANDIQTITNESDVKTALPINAILNKFQFQSFTGKVTEIRVSEDNADRTYISVEGEGERLATILITKDTYVVSQDEIKVGDTVTGYYNGNAPMIMIYPPQYHAEVVVVNDTKEIIKVDVFDKDLVSSDNFLKLNISDETKIMLQNGEGFDGELTNRKLVVSYTVSTKSIPAQTTPSQIVVLYEDAEHPIIEVDENDDNVSEVIGDVSKMDIVVENKKITAPSAYLNENGTVMVPIRAIAEALGSEVKWDDELKSVTIDKGISFTLGKDYYVYMKTAPIKLGDAPELVDGHTFVPLSFFREVMKLNNAYVFEGQIDINTGEKMQ